LVVPPARSSLPVSASVALSALPWALPTLSVIA
jgi:hypothetical protein